IMRRRLDSDLRGGVSIGPTFLLYTGTEGDGMDVELSSFLDCAKGFRGIRETIIFAFYLARLLSHSDERKEAED
ncbi:MAG TPA: hypothetical protein VF791_04220, partial [Pyrinomonadaceae bacterium]